MAEITLLSTIIEYFNSVEINGTCTRQGLIKYIDYVYYGIRYSINSVDNYRNWLMCAGYITRAATAGVYIKTKHIPETLTSSQLRKEAYPNK